MQSLLLQIFAARCCASAAYAVKRCPSVCLSVCLSVSLSVWVSVTFLYSVETNNIYLPIFFTSVSHILVFPYQMLWQYSNGDLSCRRGRHNRDSRRLSGYGSTTAAVRTKAATGIIQFTAQTAMHQSCLSQTAWTLQDEGASYDKNLNCVRLTL